MLVSKVRDGGVELRVGGDDAHIGRRSLGDHRRDPLAVLRECRAQCLEVVVGEHEGLCGDRRGNPRRGRKPKGGEAGSGLGQEPVGVAVVVTRELHEQVPASRAAGQPDRGHRRLGAGRDEADHLHGSDARGDELGQVGLAGRARPVREATRRGFLDGGNDLGVSVAKQGGTPPGDEIDVPVALHINHVRT